MGGTSIFGSIAARDAFLKELEGLMRSGEPEMALEQARTRLAGVGGGNRGLIKLAVKTDFHDIVLKGWHELGARLEEVDKAGEPVTAIGIDFSWPGHTGSKPNPLGKLAPNIETNYYADLSTLAFSAADRPALLSGYSTYGSEWQGAFLDLDSLISVDGLEELYGAVQLASKDAGKDDADGDAHALAAAIAAILLHLAVRHTIEQRGLPRKLAVLVGSNEDYPYFDAPVVTYGENSHHDDLPQPAFGLETDDKSEETSGSASPEPAASRSKETANPISGEQQSAISLNASGDTEIWITKGRRPAIRTEAVPAPYVPRGIGAFAALRANREPRAALDLNSARLLDDGEVGTLELEYASIEAPSGAGLRRRIAGNGDEPGWNNYGREEPKGLLARIFGR